ncbi:unnamed protein product [Lactuca virosa]|uniref:Uncharacterized protein n=1 Tax=Lactuca virosa TaxID=75947 RepID=A0AAU9M197_9ASTR|nr:unnamed protein product [Lactuca virosa]
MGDSLDDLHRRSPPFTTFTAGRLRNHHLLCRFIELSILGRGPLSQRGFFAAKHKKTWKEFICYNDTIDAKTLDRNATNNTQFEAMVKTWAQMRKSMSGISALLHLVTEYLRKVRCYVGL